MQYQSILNSIKRGVISPLYLIYGEEEYLQQIVINALKEALVPSDIGSFNLDELEGDKVSIGSLVDMANTLPIFAEKRLVIIKEPFFLQSGNKETEKGSTPGEETRLLEYLANPLLSTCLVFWQKGSVDKRKKIYKTLVGTGQVLEINSLRGRDLSEWLEEEAKGMGKRLEPRALEYLILNSGNQLRNLQNELEKLALYSGKEKNITYAMAQEVVTKSSEGNIFNLVDNIGLRKGEDALLELKNLLVTGEPPVKILHMITRQFRLILLVKDLAKRGAAEKQIATELSLHPFVTGKILRQTRNFSFAELERSLRLILESDIGMKTGLNPHLTLESLVFNLTAVFGDKTSVNS